MRIIENPARSEWENLTRRQGVDYEGIRPRVESILSAVEAEGDAALRRLMKEIDGVEAPLELTAPEIDAAELWTKVRQLKAIGAEGILVMDVDKIIL